MSEKQSSWRSELPAFLEEAWSHADYQSPTKVQDKSIPFILDGRDVIAEAPTGSGKTIAYLLPLLQKIDPEKKRTQVLVLASSHELVMQINAEVQAWTKGSGITSASLIGGANVKRQIDKLKKKPNIVMGTPGRVNELIQKKKLKAHEFQTIVLDEADQLLVPEHMKMVQQIINSSLKERQLLIFSATLPEKVEELAANFMKDAEVIRIQQEEMKPEVTHGYISCEDREKVELLRKAARTKDFKGLAFMKDIGSLTVFKEKLEFHHLDLAVLHSDAKKEQRAKALKGFRNGDWSLLLATDVAARGLDIPDINYIVNLDIPKEISSYIHRAGRTSRIGSQEAGTVLSLVNSVEEKRLKKYARDLNIPLQRKEIYKGEIKDN
ncbi:DEAD/DEAH box helicase [Halobacillus rhizosphaerae]|uniref:DEAD/DEAH box helicase n=1 Tax=Halobacillus rhizosphaerae TaxID=3064889 RepID=UPI00398A8735